MSAYYNENDSFAAQWLRNLIAAGHLPAGEVDERDIGNVSPQDVDGFDRCHFFAGIGGWPLALALAGWDGPAWTGSCPCQPFSAAGKQRAGIDSRHLWPEFYRLIEECRPPVVFGEQVAGKAGRRWLAGVRACLEAAGYAVGAADLCAAGVGAPHIRQRLFWVADADQIGRPGGAKDLRRETRTEDAGRDSWLGDFGCTNHWSTGVALPCLDGKTRRVEPGSFPLAHGVPARVGRLRGYGNAVVPQVAAEFVAACRP